MTIYKFWIFCFKTCSTLNKELSQLSPNTMWFDLRDVDRSGETPSWADPGQRITTGEAYWYDRLMSVRLFAAFGPNAQGENNLDNRDANGNLMRGPDGRWIGYERNCAVTNYDNTITGIWDDRECTDQYCHVCAQGWGELWHTNLGYHDYGDDETGVDEFGVGDGSTNDSDAVFTLL